MQTAAAGLGVRSTGRSLKAKITKSECLQHLFVATALTATVSPIQLDHTFNRFKTSDSKIVQLGTLSRCLKVY